MIEAALSVVKDYSPPVITLILLIGVYFIRGLRDDVHEILNNHLPHLDRRLARIEGRFKQIDEKD